MSDTAGFISQPPPPPRLTGTPERDVAILLSWINDFYRVVVREGYFLQTAEQFDADGIDGDLVVDPATASIATAQNTANEAYILAGAAKTQADRTDAGLLSGTVTISDTATTGVVTLAEALADTAFHAILVPSASTGTPAAGSRDVVTIVNATTGFTVTLGAAPGAGNSVTFNWLLHREA